MSTVVALIGSPNCGKTTVFNRLTGLRQKVGNWAGVTVEQTTGTFSSGETDFELVDLPGLYSLAGDAEHESLDTKVARQYIADGNFDVILHVLDASSLRSGLRLTMQLLALGKPVLVALNMTDVADGKGIEIDTDALERRLGCEVLSMVASKGIGRLPLRLAAQVDGAAPQIAGGASPTTATEAYAFIDRMLDEIIAQREQTTSISDVLDSVLLNRWLGIPGFMLCMYLVFYITINVGGIFIDFFDGLAGVLFVDSPAWLLGQIGAPAWAKIFIANGIGGGIQLVASFIPIIGSMFLCLAFLEASGYMTRAAFIVDRLMAQIGLPGRAFIPLIVGLGCNVPSVMATRALPSQQDRLVTVVMAPFMSCGARLTVYALFAAAFFPGNLAALLVFTLYMLGIIIAMLSGLVMRRWIISGENSASLMVMPAYHLPTLRNLLLSAWWRLHQFLFRAGKAIVIVVVVLNVVNSWGVDGSFGQENTENSYLSELSKTIAPAFEPMGIEAENWPAVVGIFTGIFAKEVVVGTLDSLYSDLADQAAQATGEVGGVANQAQSFDPLGGISDAITSIAENFSGMGDSVTDPLGLGLIGDVSTGNVAELGIQDGTLTAMQGLFGSTLAVFSYLVFVLLYVPCVATLGAIYKEQGQFWMWFSSIWSTLIAYCMAVIIFQAGTFIATGSTTALLWLVGTMIAMIISYGGLIMAGRHKVADQGFIPVRNLT